MSRGSRPGARRNRRSVHHHHHAKCQRSKGRRSLKIR